MSTPWRKKIKYKIAPQAYRNIYDLSPPFIYICDGMRDGLQEMIACWVEVEQKKNNYRRKSPEKHLR